MINILFIIDHLWNTNGGTEGQLLMLMHNLDPEKYKIHLFCLKESPWSKSPTIDYPFQVLHINKLLSLSNIPRLIAFRKYCRKNYIDIIQTYFNDATLFGAIAGRFAGVKKIIACRRNLGPGFWSNKKLLLANRALKPLITRYMANSQATRDSIAHHERIDPQKIDVIYNGLDLCRFSNITGEMRPQARVSLGLEDSDILIGMVAHLRKEKNISLLIKAAEKLRHKYSQARFIVLGEGGEREKLENEIRDLGLENIFKLGGSIMDVVPYLAAMDIACLTSNGESFSNSIIEYQAAGLPVVATGVGGNVEALPSHDFLFAPGDLDTFVSLLEKLINDKDLRMKVGQMGKSLAEKRYSIARMIAGHEQLYRKCMT